MKVMSVYGQDPTILKLTERAQAIYDSIDDLKIEEVYDGKGDVLGYHLSGRIETLCITPEEVSEIVEMLAEQ